MNYVLCKYIFTFITIQINKFTFITVHFITFITVNILFITFITINKFTFITIQIKELDSFCDPLKQDFGVFLLILQLFILEKQA